MKLDQHGTAGGLRRWGFVPKHGFMDSVQGEAVSASDLLPGDTMACGSRGTGSSPVNRNGCCMTAHLEYLLFGTVIAVMGYDPSERDTVCLTFVAGTSNTVYSIEFNSNMKVVLVSRPS